MSRKVIITFLLITSLAVGSSGATFLYIAKEMIEDSNRITYSHGGRLKIIDELIGKASREEYDKEGAIDLFMSWKEREIAEHNFILASTSFFNTAIMVVVAAQLLQLIFLICYVRKRRSA